MGIDRSAIGRDIYGVNVVDIGLIDNEFGGSDLIVGNDVDHH